MLSISAQINLIYRLSLGISIASAVALLVGLQYLNPYLNYINICIIYILGWFWLGSLVFLGWFIIKKHYLKSIIFLQTVYKAIFSSIVYSGILAMVILMLHTENLNTMTIVLLVASAVLYSVFQFLE